MRHYVLTAMLMWAAAGVANGQAAPAGSTGQCNDGTYTTATQKWQACGGHKGVKSWFAANTAKPGSTAAAPATAAPAAKTPPAASAAAPAAPAAKTAPATAATKATPAATAKTTAVAPGGGPGMVWVNLDTKVYHCPGGTFYGKTKNGKYMTEADAKAAGDRPDRGKACGK